MLNVGVIGVGNCGNQVAVLAAKELGCDVIAINSSKNDLNTLPDSIPYILIGDERGAGKNRGDAKKFLKESIMDMVQDEQFQTFMKGKDIVYIVSSTGGGTGSGISPLLSSIIRSSFRDEEGKEKTVILVGVLPKIGEAYATQTNTLEYLTELYKTLDDQTYMLYDNETLSKEPSYIMMQKINSSIVDDIKVMRGDYNIPTPYASIDEKDMKMILETPGRICISSVRDLKEKDLDEVDIEDLLVTQLKTNTHCELQRDKVVNRTGIISNLSENLNNIFDTNIPKVQEFIGVPIEDFEHVAVNPDRKLENNVFLIMAGLTNINDRINKISDRIEEIQERQNIMKEEDSLDDIDVKDLNSKRSYREKNTQTNVDLQGIFSQFGA